MTVRRSLPEGFEVRPVKPEPLSRKTLDDMSGVLLWKVTGNRLVPGSVESDWMNKIVLMGNRLQSKERPVRPAQPAQPQAQPPAEWPPCRCKHLAQDHACGFRGHPCDRCSCFDYDPVEFVPDELRRKHNVICKREGGRAKG